LSLGFRAGAEEAGDPRAAEALFAEAQGLMERGDYAGACPKLEESYRLDRATGALFVLALCHEAQGRFASAWVEFMEAASRANAERYFEREQQARQRVELLYPKLSFLTVRVDAQTATLSGLVVSRDGVQLGRAAWGTAVPVDPGRHVIEALAPGHQAWRGVVEIGAEPQKEVIWVPRLTRNVRPSLTRPAPGPRRSGGLAEQLTPLRVAGIGLGGAALASLGVAAYSSLRAAEKYDDSHDDCRDNVCGVTGDRDRTRAEEAARLATIGAIAGGALLATGAVLFLVGRPSAAKANVRASASLTGLRLEATF
jgi:tetratricopeptide (TPR) repeat protein